jgi:hypothetical protein
MHPSTVVDFFLPGIVYKDGELAEYTDWSTLPKLLRVTGMIMFVNLAIIVSMGTLDYHLKIGWKKNLALAVAVWVSVDVEQQHTLPAPLCSHITCVPCVCAHARVCVCVCVCGCIFSLSHSHSRSHALTLTLNLPLPLRTQC